MENMEYQSVEEQLDERVIEIARVSKTVKGGRRLRYRVTVVVGDNNGTVGMGSGKANAVPDAMRKASDTARKNMKKVNLYKTTITHEVYGRCGGAVVMMRPASEGTGVISGGGVRAVLEVAGVHDILTKSMGSANLLNVVKATFDAMDQLKNASDEAILRGKNAEDLTPYWDRR